MIEEIIQINNIPKDTHEAFEMVNANECPSNILSVSKTILEFRCCENVDFISTWVFDSDVIRGNAKEKATSNSGLPFNKSFSRDPPIKTLTAIQHTKKNNNQIKLYNFIYKISNRKQSGARQREWKELTSYQNGVCYKYQLRGEQTSF